MQLKSLFEGVTTRTPLWDTQILGLTADTRQLKPNDVFFCLVGFSTDGHTYAKQALEAGAAAIVCQQDLGLERQIIVEDSHATFSLCCANFYGNPQRTLKLVGVTGTNGKTTVTYLLRDALTKLGHKTGMIGTVTIDMGDYTLPAKYTTPDPHTFFSTLNEMKKNGCEYVVMEVSSHGLHQRRVEGCQFAVSVFTNLTQDHLDYHQTMEDYYLAKRQLFLQSDQAVISVDDAYGRRLTAEVPCTVKTFSVKADMADYTAKSVILKATSSTFAFVGSGLIARVKVSAPGEFSVSNTMAALSTLLSLGFTLEESAGLFAEITGVPGRFEVLKTDTPYTVIRDYAHSTDAIEKVLLALKAVSPGRVMILFGCAGSRDRTKRTAMTQTASRLADFVVFTSDNPRHEDPMQIINDGLPGLTQGKTPYRVIPDRYEAIEWALRNCKPGDTLLLAGKGHEDYQVLDDVTIHFHEGEIVAELLGKIRAEESVC